VPKKVQRELNIIFVDKMDDVLNTALIINKKRKTKTPAAPA
jgi:ATP-dependent Lon protease